VSNSKRLRRPAKRAAAKAVAAASMCADCGAKAGSPRKERRDGRTGWVVDVPHADTCPSRRMPHLRDSIGLAAVAAAQQQTGVPMEYVRNRGVVIAR
jgi:hypothetical protein